MALTDGATTTIAGALGTNGNMDAAAATDARFDTPMGLALDSQRRLLYVAEAGNRQIRSMDLVTTAVSTLAGLSSAPAAVADGFGPGSRFSQPYGIVYSASANLLYVVDVATLARGCLVAHAEGDC